MTNNNLSKAQSDLDFPTFLKWEFTNRCRKNPQYSLRSFSKAIGVSHATLSSLLSGHRPFTQKSVAKICLGLNLPKKQMEKFLKEFDTKKKRPITSKHSLLSLDTFASISDWYHDAILELTQLDTFKGDIKWIANKLNITRTEASLAVERLVRMEQLSIREDGKWIDCSHFNTTNITNDISSFALKNHQKQLLQLSLAALESMPRTERDHSSITIAIQKSDLPEVKEKIKRFRLELAEFLESKNKSPDSVYQFTFSAFPLTQN